HIRAAALSPALVPLTETPRQRRTKITLPTPATENFGELGKSRLDRRKRLARSAAGAIDQAAGQALRVIEQNLEQVLGGELLMALAQGQRLRGLDITPGAIGVFFEIHVSSLGLPLAWVERAGVSPPLT